VITYVRGIVASTGPTDAFVEIDAGSELVVAEVAMDPGRVEVGSAVVAARSRIDVGVVQHDLTLLLGLWPKEAPDPSGPDGLSLTPVIVLPDPVWTDLARAGAERAGKRPSCLQVPFDAPAFGLQLLLDAAEGVEVFLVEGGTAAHLRVARALGARPLPVLPLPDAAAIEALFAGCDLDVHVAIPALDETQGAWIHELIAPLSLETIHHVVDVDPGPAFGEAGIDGTGATLEAAAAAATGVLAGRLAAENRRWRDRGTG
jgi:hypothetical protein